MPSSSVCGGAPLRVKLVAWPDRLAYNKNNILCPILSFGSFLPILSISAAAAAR